MSPNGIPPDESPTRDDLLAEARRLVHMSAGTTPGAREVLWVDGRAVVLRALPPSLPEPGSPEWWASSPGVRIAALLVLAEAQLVADPERQVQQLLRQVAQAISSGVDWSAAAKSTSHAELMRRRYPPTGNPELWARYGPDGPPGWKEDAA